MTSDNSDALRGSSLVWATWALFVGLGIMFIGGGLFATIVGVRSEQLGFGDMAIAIIGASYYGGFLLGSWIATKALGKVGHVRVYTALAALLCASALGVGLAGHPAWWIVLRFAAGMCLAGIYVTAESWLNRLATNDNRGRLLAVYSVVSYGMWGIGQVLIGPVGGNLKGFVLAAIFISLAVAPVALSEEATPPPIEQSEPISLRDLAKATETGVGAALLVGVAHGLLLGLIAVYAIRSGLSANETGLLVASPALGAVMLQWPIAQASDDLDRRMVGALIAMMAVGISLCLLVAGPQGWTGMALMALIGGMSFPLYSFALAYTNDWVPSRYAASAASKLVMLYGVGALAGPPIGSTAMALIGTDGYVWGLAGVHTVIAVFLVYRMFAWRAPLIPPTLDEVGLPTRVFVLPATVAIAVRSAGRRRRKQRSVG